MQDIQFVRLSDIDEQLIIDLMKNEAVGRHLPLLNGAFDNETCRGFLDAKQQLWEEHGYGPHAFLINGEFAGWGGLQPEQGEPDFALVLHPKFWGWGRRIFLKVKELAFGEMGLDYITILLPPDRGNLRAVLRLGFVEEGELVVNEETFLKFCFYQCRF